MKPFENVRVLDLTHVLAGPFCSHQLAMLGADVIKVEPPSHPDMTRSEGVDPVQSAELYGSYFLAQSAGKRAMTLDLKSEGGQAIMHRLLQSADVLLQNYAGTALGDLGFGPEAAHAINPRLIYCMLSGFGHSGPKADHPAYDNVIQAYSGLMAANGDPETGPLRVGPPMVDYGTGAQAAMAISAALFQRTQTNKGQVIDVSMLDSALMLMSAMVVDSTITGTSPKRHGSDHPYYAGYRTYETSDGTIMLGAYTNEQLAKLFDALGETTRAAEVRATPRADIAASAKADAAMVANNLLSRPATEWEDVLNNAHVPAAKIRHLTETLAEEQVKLRGGLQSPGWPDKDTAPAQLPVAGFEFAHGGPSIDRVPPQFGEHTNEVLSEIGYSPTEITELQKQGVV
ncbi:MAG: CaiB/BaiF CoA transferase family protein [Pikeienuella sp.]